MLHHSHYLPLVVASVLTTCAAPHSTDAMPQGLNGLHSSVSASTTSSSQDALNVFFGNLHAHSRLSDGNSDISPTEAFRIAKEEGNLDFLSLSEHNHMLTAAEMQELRAAADQATTNNFVALFGQEYSFISKGNHTNIHNYPVAIPKSFNGQYKKIFEEILPQFQMTNLGFTIVAGFNHPNQKDKDYGLDVDYNGDMEAFVKGLDPYVQLIAIASGPADANNKTFVPSTAQRFAHLKETSKARWLHYVSHGMHLAPKIDHDTHSPTYGFRSAARTGVWVHGTLTKDKLLAALFARHCYASEDLNLKVFATVNDSHLPGDILRPSEVPGDELTVILKLEDPDEPNATYRIRVRGGLVGNGQTPDLLDDVQETWIGNTEVTLAIPVDTDLSSYFVIHVLQEKTSNSPCGLNDDIWLAPIWIEQPLVADDAQPDELPVENFPFLASRRSKVYHHSSCSVAAQIKETNLVFFESESAAQEGRRLHRGCPK